MALQQFPESPEKLCLFCSGSLVPGIEVYSDAVGSHWFAPFWFENIWHFHILLSSAKWVLVKTSTGTLVWELLLLEQNASTSDPTPSSSRREGGSRVEAINPFITTFLILRPPKITKLRTWCLCAGHLQAIKKWNKRKQQNPNNPKAELQNLLALHPDKFYVYSVCCKPLSLHHPSAGTALPKGGIFGQPVAVPSCWISLYLDNSFTS